MKYLLIILASNILVFSAFAQNNHDRAGRGVIYGPSIGYQYQNAHFLKASGWLLFAPGGSYSQYIKIDGGANLAWLKDRTTVIPELGVTYYLDNRLIWPYIKAEITPFAITPKFGVSLSSLMDIGLGYGFSIKDKENRRSIKGFSISLGFNLPLNFYLD